MAGLPTLTQPFNLHHSLVRGHKTGSDVLEEQEKCMMRENKTKTLSTRRDIVFSEGMLVT